MRWKAIRRRFAVRAPRLIVRSHLPWPLRYAIAAVVLGFSAALAVWAFEFGKEIAGVDAASKAELLRLKREVAELGAQRDQAQTLANVADSLIKAERAANEKLVQEMRVLEDRKQALESDLGFFERLLPAVGTPFQVRALQADILAPGQLRYQMLVMQGGKDLKEFNGRYDIVLSGTLDGMPWTASLPTGPMGLKLRQYTRVEGLIDFPPEAVLQAVQARVVDVQGVVRAAEFIKLP